jgi:hypothetical protein
VERAFQGVEGSIANDFGSWLEVDGFSWAVLEKKQKEEHAKVGKHIQLLPLLIIGHTCKG